jgi:Tfp pilus assembly protein PilF
VGQPILAAAAFQAARTKSRFLLSLLLLLCILSGCQKKTQGPPPRYAFVRFENLSGDASLDWVGRAATEFLSWSLSGAMDGAVLNAQALGRAANGMGAAPSDRAKAEIAGATRLITGYIERYNGELRMSASDEDLITHKTVRIVTSEAAEPMAALLQLARNFSPSARPYLTTKPEVLRLYSSALDESPEKAVPDLKAAASADPNFGPAWVSLAEAGVLRGDRALVLEAAGDGLTHKIDPASGAALRLRKALLENDKAAQLAALRELEAANPGDLLLLHSLAETESLFGDFKASASHWKKLRQAAPNDRDAWNQVGYSLAWSGDYAAAAAAMKEYAARWPDDPNPLDSSGDVEYLYGKFASASAFYEKANGKSPQFLNGGALYKAAWALFRAGDKAKADAAFAKFKAVREKAGDAGVVQFEGDWLYRTGREKEAFSLFRFRAASSSEPALQSALWSQLVIWELLSKDRVAAARDAAIEATRPGSNVSAVARFAALPSASVAEWQTRAESLLRGPAVASARRFALAVALLLDGKKEAARPFWDEIARDTTATDFFSLAIASKVKGEKPRLELLPDPMTVNQLRALADLP